MLGQMSEDEITLFYYTAKTCKTLSDFLDYADNEKKLHHQKVLVNSRRKEWREQENMYKTERAILQNMCKHPASKGAKECLYCERDMTIDVGGFGYDG